ncbi:hypothetical protein GF340_01635 [Candidatus Peregrinibacteria bacterium]|nr:hypothetical protein [Candidatus Peregrinibacteria bacterium]
MINNNSLLHLQLDQLGLNEKEILVYTALNRMGTSLASSLAVKTGIKRTSVYDVLNSLIDKNLIVQFKMHGSSYYAIDDVQKLVLLQKERINTANDAVEILKAEHHKNDIQVQHFFGLEGYRFMYRNILDSEPKELLGWINLDNFHTLMDSQIENQWTKQRIEMGIFTRLIMQDTPYARNFQKQDKESCRETRLIPKGKYDFSSNCFLYQERIVYLTSQKPISGIRIHNAELFEMNKQFFDMVWGTLNKVTD